MYLLPGANPNGREDVQVRDEGRRNGLEEVHKYETVFPGLTAYNFIEEIMTCSKKIVVRRV